jgi:hypothetical protein
MPDDQIPASGRLVDRLNAGVPHAARIWNYWMGGKDNFEADRRTGDAVAEVYPEIVTMAVQSRPFLIRTVRFLAGEVGIRQFIDIGSGLPTMHNTHEVAQSIASDARIVYVDNDALVLAHARALLTNTSPDGVTRYVDADFHRPELILSDVRTMLDFDEPIGVMFMGVLGYVEDLEAMRSIVAQVMDAVPSGSSLTLWDGTDTSEAVIAGAQRLAESGGVPYYLRSPQDLAGCFEGLKIVEPGLVPITRWRPDPAAGEAPPIDAYGAIGLKP